jgi:hypothetical protein
MTDDLLRAWSRLRWDELIVALDACAATHEADTVMSGS